MEKTLVALRMDADLKQQFEEFCADMGMTMTSAYNAFARKTVREYRIPFEIGGERPKTETADAVTEDVRMKDKPNLSKAKATTNTTFLMDADLRRQFEDFCADVGMSMPSVFNVFVRKTVREYKMPFEIGGDAPNAEASR